jgi:hypothetical protein
MGRQNPNDFYMGIGPAVPPPHPHPPHSTGDSPSDDSDKPSQDSTAMGCDNDSDPSSNAWQAAIDENGTTDNNSKNTNPGTTGNSKNPNSTTSPVSGGPPAIAKRRFRSSMRRSNGKVSKTSKPSIFEREGPSSPTITAREPATIGDIVTRYLEQRAALRKRANGAMSPRTSRGAK